MSPSCTRCNRPLKNPASVRAGMGPVCFALAMAEGRPGSREPRSSYRVVAVDADRRMLWIVDLDRGRSVTNDAEAVVAALNAQYPGFRVIYRDTLGMWDELEHVDGRFVGFAPARNLAPQEVIS